MAVDSATVEAGFVQIEAGFRMAGCWRTRVAKDDRATRTISPTARTTSVSTWRETGRGDGSPATTFYNDGTGPDPCPSLGGKFPFAATDAQVHKYTMAGTYTLALKVSDDGGGRETRILNVLI